MTLRLFVLSIVFTLIECSNLRSLGHGAKKDSDSSIRDRIAWAWEMSRMHGQKNDKVALPWANLNADRGKFFEHGDSRALETDPGTFSLSQFEHPDMRDDEDME